MASMNPLMIGQLISGLIGAASEYRMGMEDRQYWKDLTRQAGEGYDRTLQTVLGGGSTRNLPGGKSGGMSDAISQLLVQAGIVPDRTSYKGLLDIVAEMGPEYGKLAEKIKSGTTGIEQGVSSGYGDLGKQLRSLTDTINKGWSGRTGELMNILQGSGQQAKRDIEQRTRSQIGTTTAQLASAGLGGTSVGASMRAGAAREQENALGRLEESLRQQKLDIYGTATAQQLEAQRAMGLEQIGLGERGVGATAEAKRWGVDTRAAADQFTLANLERLQMLPLDFIGSQNREKQAAMLAQGLPPSVTPFASSVSQMFGNIWSAQQANKSQDTGSHGSVSILGTGFGW